MKRVVWICLIVFMIAAALLAFHRDLLPLYLYFCAGKAGGEEEAAVELEEELSSGGGNAAADHDELPAAGIQSLAGQIVTGISDDYGKLCAIYDWITANIAYDVEKAENMEAYGSGAEYLLEKRKGVCHDYADLTRALLTAVGIEATYERGDIHPSLGRTERHAWNNARIGESWYALDTTWGAGFVDQEKGVFVQRPSRLYLTTLDELARLHNDPSYKESREMEVRRAEASAAKPAYLPEHEARLLALINDTRAAAGLAPFTEEERLLATARQSAAAAAERACSGEEYSLDSLKEELERRALELRLEKAGMYTFTLWDYPVPTAEEIHRHMTGEENSYLNDAEFQSLTAAVIRRGDLIIVVLIFLSHY